MIVRQDFEERLQGWKWRQKQSQAGRLHADCGSWRSVLTSGRFDVGFRNLLRDKPGRALGRAGCPLCCSLAAVESEARGCWEVQQRGRCHPQTKRSGTTARGVQSSGKSSSSMIQGTACETLSKRKIFSLCGDCWAVQPQYSGRLTVSPKRAQTWSAAQVEVWRVWQGIPAVAGQPLGGRVWYATPAFRRQHSRFHPLRDAGPEDCEASGVALDASADGNVGREGDIFAFCIFGLWSFGGRMSPRTRPAWKECRLGQRAAFDDTAGRLHSVRIDEQPRCLTLDLHPEWTQWTQWSARSCYLGDAIAMLGGCWGMLGDCSWQHGTHETIARC